MEDVTGLEVRMAPTDSPGTAPSLSTFGTFDGGGEHDCTMNNQIYNNTNWKLVTSR